MGTPIAPNALGVATTLSADDLLFVSLDGISVRSITVTDFFTDVILLGSPVAPTPAPGDNSGAVATTAFVTAAIGDIDLGAYQPLAERTDVGEAFYTLPNPSAVTFPRINADNTVDALNDADMRAALDLYSTTEVQNYVQDQLDGRSWKQPVRLMTAAALPSNSYDNGSFGVGATLTASSNGALANIDGTAPGLNNRILVNNESFLYTNGIYVVTDLGSAGSPWVLTRAGDANTGTELKQATVVVQEGTANHDKQFTNLADGSIVVGVSSLLWGQTSTDTTYSADESTLHLSGTTFSIASGGLAVNFHASTAKGTLANNDEFVIADSAASNVQKKTLWSTIVATLNALYDWATVVHAATGKTTPVDNDELGIIDSAASNVLKKLTFANLKIWQRTPSIQAVTSSATVTPTFSDDMVKITAQAAALSLANPTGTAIPGLGMVIRIKDNGTARAITYDTQYRAIGITLPTTTVISKTTYIAMIYNADDTKWDCIATGTEA